MRDPVLLHVRGRDVEESETPLQFNKDTCRWTMLGAEAAKEAVSSERQQIIDALRTFRPAHEKDGLSVAEIMAATERTDRNAVDQILFKMSRDGDIQRVRRGIYAVPQDAGKMDKKERKVVLGPELEGKTHNLTYLTDLTGGWISARSGRNDFNQDDGLEIPDFLRRALTQ